MLNGVPGPLTVSIGVVAALAAGVLVYRDARRHDHYHALSASAAVVIAALVGFAVGNLVGLAVATGYVLLLYLLSYPSTPGVDGAATRRSAEDAEAAPQGDSGAGPTGVDDLVSVIRVEMAGEETLRELAERYDVPADAPAAELRSRLRVTALENVLERADTDGSPSVGDWATAVAEASVDDWHEASTESERPAEGAAAWNAAPSGDDEAEDDEPRPENDEWSVAVVDEDADEVGDIGNMQEWATLGDGGEEQTEAAGESRADAGDFGWAEVEAEE